MSQDPYAPPAAPQISPSEERQWGMFAHLAPLIAMVLSAGTLGFVGSLIIYFLYRDKGPFVRAHAANSVNIQIMTAIILLVSLPLMLLLIGFVTFPLAIVFAFVLHIIGAIKANAGEWWTPMLTPNFVR